MVVGLRMNALNGVKERKDGLGDAWANEHRDELGTALYMHDLDAIFGRVDFAQNTGDRLFMEYAVDGYQNRMNLRREFAVLAIFDRKRSRAFALSDANRLSTGLYMWLCRCLGSAQAVKPRFFYVCGVCSPWEMIEVDIETGEVAGSAMLERGNWRVVWERFGLTRSYGDLTLSLRMGSCP